MAGRPDGWSVGRDATSVQATAFEAEARTIGLPHDQGARDPKRDDFFRARKARRMHQKAVRGAAKVEGEILTVFVSPFGRLQKKTHSTGWQGWTAHSTGWQGWTTHSTRGQCPKCSFCRGVASGFYSHWFTHVQVMLCSWVVVGKCRKC